MKTKKIRRHLKNIFIKVIVCLAFLYCLVFASAIDSIDNGIFYLVFGGCFAFLIFVVYANEAFNFQQFSKLAHK